MSPVKDIPMHRTELIVLVASMFACVAFSIDSMLPALPDMGAALSPEDPNRAGMVLTVFVLGLGIGTFVTGPLSDAFGRRVVILCGAAAFIGAAALAWQADTLETLLVARLMQGVSAAGPRIVALAVLRDVFSGRAMAQVMSLAMMVFMIVPAIAPLMGSLVIAALDWHGIFLAFMAFMGAIMIWVAVRLPETLEVADRRPFRAPVLWAALLEMVQHPTVRISILVQALSMGILFSMLTLVQPVYDQVFDRAGSFPYWFGAVAIVAGSAALVNATLVMRVGMRRMVTISYFGQMLISGAVLVLFQSGLSDTAIFTVFVAWQVSVFFMAGLTMGNLNAIAMEPMGHIAGMAASIIGGIATVLAAPIATIVGLTFDGTPRPLALGILVLSIAGYVLMLAMYRVEARQTA
ncbi:MFS transporter [Marinibacterium profundimaris]|uniref:Multidrug MFS transporter n=1 Tax=Marinibacterium profundimaris TaxID=1679460 RepID=A0A225NVT6_9RHOB|nr:MFS transporter [Marinibacterium profundimaris]OWU77408.1 multidrug MFS transporter [Marinibacterium profundimaris]